MLVYRLSLGISYPGLDVDTFVCNILRRHSLSVLRAPAEGGWSADLKGVSLIRLPVAGVTGDSDISVRVPGITVR